MTHHEERVPDDCEQPSGKDGVGGVHELRKAAGAHVLAAGVVQVVHTVSDRQRRADRRGCTVGGGTGSAAFSVGRHLMTMTVSSFSVFIARPADWQTPSPVIPE